MSELLRTFEYKNIESTDISNFKFEDNVDFITEMANTYYNEWEYHGYYPSANIEHLKKFIAYHK
jgi:hypothetical protein